ncbi:uncharacterized protein ARMOST_02928 [Armillaria ostoyae]|uniref:Uncharacterized protein n=1 Tax=Armillaria ostoyae TaxID=47428 RepID=A0A284QT27_ARMOS|nr:uncharacterized protein ARMOST_02928 [Armillaria ostoyae]
MKETSDLNTVQTIALSSAILAIVFTVFTTSYIILVHGDRIRNLLHRRGILVPLQPQPIRAALFPAHYVLLYANIKPRLAGLGLASEHNLTEDTSPSHRRPTTVSSSDESFLCRETPPRNTTPGPSNVPRTPSPTPAASTNEADREVWPTTPELPLYLPRCLLMSLSCTRIGVSNSRPPLYFPTTSQTRILVPSPGCFSSDNEDSDSDSEPLNP